MGKIHNPEMPGGFLKATYKHANLPEHAGNPLVEALPPFCQASKMMDSFGRYPNISDNERSLPVSERMQAVSRLNNYLEPLTAHFDVIDKIGLIIRAGYTYRNPANPDTRKMHVEFYRQAMEGNIRPIGDSAPSTAPSVALFGTSGVGKSTVVERALSYLPQVLLHEELSFVQVVWMKLDCPPDGSLKQFLGEMLNSFDKLLGTTYGTSLNKTTTIDKLIFDVAKIAAMHCLGLLVIDETQNLLDGSGVGQEKMLNFFLTFANVVKIPLVTIGTPRALGLLNHQFRTARRVGDHGTYIWDRLAFGDEWDFFIDGIWKYQWTAKYVHLTSNLSKLVYDNTQGIHALVVRLFQLAQLQAIGDGSEVLTVELIEKVVSDRFRLVKPMLDIIASGKSKGSYKTEKLIEDLYVDGLKNLKGEIDKAAKNAALKAQAHEKSTNAAERTRAVSALISLGYPEDQAQSAVTGLFDVNPEMTSNIVVRTILESIEGIGEGKDTSDRDSLKSIIQSASEVGVSPATALITSGIIESPIQGK